MTIECSSVQFRPRHRTHRGVPDRCLGDPDRPPTASSMAITKTADDVANPAATARPTTSLSLPARPIETDAPRSSKSKSRRPRRKCLDFSLLIGGLGAFVVNLRVWEDLAGNLHRQP